MADYDIGASDDLVDVNGFAYEIGILSSHKIEFLATPIILPDIRNVYDNFINKKMFMHINDNYSSDNPIIAPQDAVKLFDLHNGNYMGYFLVCHSRDRDIITPPVSLDVRDRWGYKFCRFNYNGEKTESNPKGFQYEVNQYSPYFYDMGCVKNMYPQASHPDELYFTPTNQYFLYPARRNDNSFVMTYDFTKRDVSPKTLYFGYDELNTEIEWGSYSFIQAVFGSVSVDDITKDSPDSSSTGGGGGTYDISSDTIDFPDLPSLSASNSGLIALYNPSISQLMDLSDWLWSKSLLDTLEKMYAQPMDLIVSLNIVPVAPTHFDGVQAIKIGGVDTDVSAQKLSSQYEIFDCGYIDVPEYYGSAMDYGQYTRVSLYLPFCNVVELKTDEIMGGRVHVKYYIDMFNGSCVAMVKCTRQNLNSVLYSFEGNIAVNLPVTSTDFSNMYNAIIKGGVNAIQSGSPISGAVDTALNVMFSKPNVQRSGTVSSSGGLLGLKKPYLIIERAIQSLPSSYAQNYGYPSNITDYLYNLNGYTEIESVITNNLRCTQVEQDEIINLLKEGVII